MSKLKEKWRIFSLLMYKNFLVRKRHWKSAIFVQIMLPVLLFLFVQTIRTLILKPIDSPSKPSKNNNNSIYKISEMDILIKEHDYVLKYITIYYTPIDEFTNQTMTSVRDCLSFPNDCNLF